MAYSNLQKIGRLDIKLPECKAGLQAKGASKGLRRSVSIKAADDGKRTTIDSLDSLLGSSGEGKRLASSDGWKE